MILVDWKIKELLKEGALGVTPLGEDQIGAASIDLRLGREAIIFHENVMEEITRPIDHIWSQDDSSRSKSDILSLAPKQFGLFTTMESLRIPPNLVAQIEGRSSIGRQGIFVHNAGYIDPGFIGQITLELFNATDHIVTIPAGTRICQIVLFECDIPEVPYNKRETSKYVNQVGVTISRINEELKNEK